MANTTTTMVKSVVRGPVSEGEAAGVKGVLYASEWRWRVGKEVARVRADADEARDEVQYWVDWSHHCK